MNTIIRTNARYVEDTDAIRRRFAKMPTYPAGDGNMWQSFLQAQEGKKGLFMLIVERQISHQEIAFRPHVEKLFGLYSDRADNKLGKHCFGWATPDFVGEGKAYEGIFVTDGYDPKFLHTFDISNDGKREFLNIPHKQYKVVEVIDSEDAVVEEIAKLARRFIPTEVATKEQAVMLVRICSILSIILDEQPNSVITGARKDVALEIKGRWSLLKEENEKYAAQIATNEEEIFDLVAKSL